MKLEKSGTGRTYPLLSFSGSDKESDECLVFIEK